jgi:hypothetical protein
LTSGTDRLACDTAVCAIQLGYYDKVVKLLEAGQAGFWSQALQLLTHMTQLYETYPELERKKTKNLLLQRIYLTGST